MRYRLCRQIGFCLIALGVTACVGGTVTPAQKLALQNPATAGDSNLAEAPNELAPTAWPTVLPELAEGCKRGLAYDLNSMADVNVLTPGVSWFYRWSVAPNPLLDANALPTSVRFTPMLWGSRALTDIGTAPLAVSDTLLGFNEPNFYSQANLSPAQAAALWPQVEAAAKASGLKLVSPAVNYCGGGCWETSPFTWLDKFFAACPTCQVDYIAIHWYACSASALRGYLSQVEARYHKKVWLTEFSCGDANDVSAAAQLAYMKEALPYLESDPMVARYAWFTGRWPERPGAALLAADGTLTELGQFYVAYPSACKK